MKKNIIIVILFISLILSSNIYAQESLNVDPFYIKLFEEGKFFYANGSHYETIENIGVAFFGFLDFPDKLLECYVYLTVCYFEVKDFEQSEYYYKEIKRLKLHEYLPEIQLYAGLRERYNEIVTKLDPPPKPAKTPTPEEVAKSEKKKISEEIKELKNTIKRDSQNYDAYRRLSSLYIEQRKYKDARKTWEKLIKIEPDNGEAHLERGKTYALERKTKDALKCFEKAGDLIPDNIEVPYEKGRIFFNQKDYIKAKQEFEKVQAVDANFKDTQQLYDTCLERIKKKSIS